MIIRNEISLVLSSAAVFTFAFGANTEPAHRDTVGIQQSVRAKPASKDPSADIQAAPGESGTILKKQAPSIAATDSSAPAKLPDQKPVSPGLQAPIIAAEKKGTNQRDSVKSRSDSIHLLSVKPAVKSPDTSAKKPDTNAALIRSGAKNAVDSIEKTNSAIIPKADAPDASHQHDKTPAVIPDSNTLKAANSQPNRSLQKVVDSTSDKKPVQILSIDHRPDSSGSFAKNLKMLRDSAFFEVAVTSSATSVVALTIRDAIDLLLKNNADVSSTRLEWAANQRKAMASLGAFEPTVSGSYKNSQTGYNNRPLPEQTSETSAGIGGKIATGGEYSYGFSLTDIQHSRSSLDMPKAFSGISGKQPLLRGAWFGAPVVELRAAYLEREIAFQTYRSKIMEMITEFENAYWNTAFAQQKVLFAWQSVGIARKVVEDSRYRVKTGKMSQIDLMEADAGLAARQANLADAQQELLDAIDRLKLLLTTKEIGRNALILCGEVICPDSIDMIDIVNEGATDDSLVRLHPDIRIKQLELDKQTILLGYRKDRCLPEVNVQGSYGFNGYGMVSNTALYRLFNDPKPAWSAGVEVGIPLMAGLEARNLYAAQKFSTEAAAKNLSAIQYQIENSFRIVAKRSVALRNRARNARVVVDFREKLLDVEIKKVDAGKSNNRFVYETEEKLSEAKQWELESHVSLRIALAQKSKIGGSLLRELGLESIVNGKPVLTGALKVEP